MSTPEDLEADAYHELLTDAQYMEHETFHIDGPLGAVEGCWLCEQEAEEKAADAHRSFVRGMVDVYAEASRIERLRGLKS